MRGVSQNNHDMEGGVATSGPTCLPSPSVPQSQPLQARSSNSGTSVKRSDNISQSSYPAGDISCDKAFNGWAKSSSSAQQPVPGQLTSVFAAQRRDLSPLGASSTATTKETPVGSHSKRSSGNYHRQHGKEDNCSAAFEYHSAQVELAASSSSKQGNVGASTRSHGRSTRANHEQRAVKDTAALLEANQQIQQTSIEKAETILRPVKQSNSETGTARTTRSKSKAKQQSRLNET